jgi:amino acid adenylation domain-containing protein
LAFLLGDAQARALVTDQPALPLIPCPLVPIESAAAEDHSPVAERGRGDALAHVIYTSGSTGTPKGVLVEHRMVSARFAAAAPWLAAGPEDTWSLFHSIATDLSVWELWGALLHGGRLVIVPRGSPDELYALLARQAVTVLSQTPSAFRLLSAVATTRPRLGALRHLILGGEALWPDDLAAFLAHYGDERPRIFNLYGPTETTLFVTCREMSPRDLGDRRSLIGRPIAAVTAHVLDDELQPVPVGVAGELHIGGAGVARGYAGRPEETAWRFFADPFAPRPGARLYRTGDRVRLTRDGELEYLGRVDEQLKVRGHRVEPGEIEAALSRHPAVREAAVVLDSAARLVAFWVGEASDELRGHLTSLLPAHMVPATFVRMARLPRTSSGKLDRRALRALPLEAAPAPLAAPATADEQALADIWGEVLLHAPSSVDERFFDIGGNSLLVLRVLALVRERLEVELPVRTLFEAQTVRAQAAAIALARGRGAAPPIPRLPAGSSPPLSINQEWVGDEQVGLLYFRGYAGDLDLAALERGANDVVARHDTLRTSFPRVDGRRRAVVAADARVALVHHDLRALPAEARPGEALRHLREMVAPFDPSLAPLVRLAVLRMADRHHLLCVAIDHRVGDGASLTVLTEELARRYELHREGRATPCAALPVQYGDFAAWQRTLHEGPVGAAQRAHWEGLLRGVPPLALPVDWPRPAVEAPLHPGERIAWEIPPGLRPVLEQLARDERATLGMVMLAAFGSALGTWCGQRDFAVETVHANRHRPGTAELIGYLAQTWALRFRLIEGSSFRQRVRAVRDDVLRATEHADFAPLLWPQRVGFNYVVFGPLRLAGLEPWDFTPPEQLLPRKTQRPDLLFNVFQTERGLGGGMRYRSDLFRRDTIEAFLRLFDQLMAEVAAGAEERW